MIADLLKIHKFDHYKGTTIFKQAKAAHCNVMHNVCKMFTDCCTHCVSLLSRKKPVAGIKNITTAGFGICGQDDLIDFQSMPDGNF
jgi:hypothetical protein